MKTIVGLYKSVDQANKVKSMLTSQGFDSQDITVIDQSKESYDPSTTSGYDATSGEDHESVGGRIKHFFSSLSGSDDEAHDSYARGVSGGGAVVAVHVQDNRADEVADLLDQNGASEIEGAYGSSYGGGYAAPQGNTLGADAGDRDFGTGTGTLSGASGINNTDSYATGSTGADYGKADYNKTTGYNDADRNLSNEQVIPIVEENLQVGKRQVQRGGVRVYTRLVETPVSESVNLHDERIVVDRRPVDRAATDADFNTGAGVVELTATGEEAVVGKKSRVVEEVLVGKEGMDHTEQINDTVRHTEVDVEPITGETTTTGVGGTTRRS